MTPCASSALADDASVPMERIEVLLAFTPLDVGQRDVGAPKSWRTTAPGWRASASMILTWASGIDAATW